MIQTLAITVVVEGIVCLLYAAWRKKPFWPILLTSILANIVTQSLLWIALNLFFHHYLATLLVSEILIWLMEAMALYGLRLNQLSMRESVFLSFLMNLSSFGAGLWLPI